jgi:hypothetical protein
MKPVRFDIKEPKRSTKQLTVLGWTILLTGIVLSFALDMETNGRSFIIGVPLIGGLLILLSLKVVYPLTNQGFIEFSDSRVRILNDQEERIIDLNDVTEIELRIGGGYMTMNKSWWPLSREFFPYEHGHDNEIYLKKTDGNKIKSRLYLTGERHEGKVKKMLSELTDKLNIELKIKNN